GVRPANCFLNWRRLMNMAAKSIRMICSGGDKMLAEWDTESVTPQQIAQIEKELNDKVKQRWVAADISEKQEGLIEKFDPNAEILMIPRVQGGSQPYDGK